MAIEYIGSGTWRVPSNTELDKFYDVQPFVPHCPCRGFGFRQGCTHLRSVAVLAQVEVAEPEPPKMPKEMPEITTSRYGNRHISESGYVPVRISRGGPRFKIDYEYESVFDLAPTTFEFKLLGEEFRSSYVSRMATIGVARVATILKTISDENGGKPLVLLCFERTYQGEPCHRRMLARWWEDTTGQEWPELYDPEAAEYAKTQEVALF